MNIILACFLIETITKLIKNAFPVIKDTQTYVVSIVIGILICVSYQINVIPLTPYELVGQIITGILASRGANYVNDILKVIKNKGVNP